LSILEDVIVIIGNQLDRNPAEFNAETDLADEGFTSLDTVEVTFELEQKFRINFKYNANEAYGGERRTVGDIVKMVQHFITQRDGG